MRALLLLGLCLHKLMWEVLKRSEPASTAAQVPRSSRRLSVKVLKVAALGGLLLQTSRLDLFPIRRRPHALRRLGLVLYLTGLTTAILGRWQLGTNWVDLEDARVLPDQTLVSHGIYRFIRHPIYAGDLLLLTGLQLALNSWLVLGMCALFILVTKRAAAEEVLLTASFPGYAAYRCSSKRFIPFVF